jgi:hypothetical protein
MGGTRTTFVVHVPQKMVLIGTSKHTADLSSLYENGSKTCIRPSQLNFQEIFITGPGYSTWRLGFCPHLPPAVAPLGTSG